MFHAWTNLFEITGAAGGQLIGLLFVAVTLGAGLSPSQTADGVRAFMTPTLVNFSGVLFQAVVVLTPWPSDWPIGAILVVTGLVGLVYRLRAIGLKRRLGDLVALSRLDWIAYNGAPVLANLALVLGGVGVIAGQAFAPYAVASASVLLLAGGIYGAWDLTLWMIKNRRAT